MIRVCSFFVCCVFVFWDWKKDWWVKKWKNKKKQFDNYNSEKEKGEIDETANKYELGFFWIQWDGKRILVEEEPFLSLTA